MSTKEYKQLTFHIDTLKAREEMLYPQSTYGKINKILIENGFVKNGRSTYISKALIDEDELFEVLSKIKSKCPELEHILRECYEKDMTTEMEDWSIDYTGFFTKDGKLTVFDNAYEK